VVAGLLISRIGLRDTALGYGTFVALVAAGALGLEQLTVGRAQMLSSRPSRR
jgi:hypothetical protein